MCPYCTVFHAWGVCRDHPGVHHGDPYPDDGTLIKCRRCRQIFRVQHRDPADYPEFELVPGSCTLEKTDQPPWWDWKWWMASKRKPSSSAVD